MPCSNCSRCETSLLLMPFPNCKLVLVQWQGVRVQHVQDDHHEQGAGEHRDGPEDPHEQRGGEVERPEPHGPEVAAPDDGALHVVRRHVGVEGGDEEAGLDVVPRRVDEAGEGCEEADEKGDVLDGGRGLAAVTVDELRHEHLGGAADPGPNEGAQRDGEGGQVGGRRDVVGDDAQRQAGLVGGRPDHAAHPGGLVVVLVADDGGAGVPEDPVEEEEVVAEHDHQATGHQHQVQGALLQLHLLLSSPAVLSL